MNITNGSRLICQCSSLHNFLFLFLKVDRDNAKLLNATWLVIITFLSVGYGDMTPYTYCGRIIAAIVGLLGAG